MNAWRRTILTECTPPPLYRRHRRYHPQEPNTDAGPLRFSIHLQSGHTLLADLHLCYDQVQGNSGSAASKASSAAPAPAGGAATGGSGAVAMCSADSQSEWTTWCEGWMRAFQNCWRVCVCACVRVYMPARRPVVGTRHRLRVCHAALFSHVPLSPSPSPSPSPPPPLTLAGAW